MSFSDRLNAGPTVLEVIPPRVGAPERVIQRHVDDVGSMLSQGVEIDALNVPEILGSGFQSMDPLEYGTLLHERYGVDLVINRIVAHQPLPRFEDWFRKVLDAPIQSVILVGGERSGIYYPGPSVRQANRQAKMLAQEVGRSSFPVGNITLPSRPREAARMLEKIRSGADYFCTQIVYDAPSTNAHLQAYDDVCRLAEVAPRPVLYAVSPVHGEQDVLFLRYLGVNIPPDIERKLLQSHDDAGPSIEVIQSIWNTLLGHAAERDVAVPLGLVMETVSKHNSDTVPSLLNQLQARLRQHRLKVVT